MRQLHRAVGLSSGARFAALASLTSLAMACGGEPTEPRTPSPPPIPSVTPKVERTIPVHTRKADVVDEMFGTRVADPYRWLEDGDADEVKQWTERENVATRAVLDPMPGR